MIYGIDPSVASTGISNGTDHALIEIPPADEWEDSVKRIDEQMARIATFIPFGPAHVYVEGPMLRVNTKGASGAAIGHLFDMGMWFYAFDQLARHCKWKVVYVGPSTLKSFIGGKGNLQKQLVLRFAYKKWGLEIDGDSGLDKLHAACLVKYGEAVERGEFIHVPYSRRGKGAASRAATARKNKRTEAQV